MSTNSNAEFPLWALLPKKETGVTSFLNKYPEFDGRGVKIAIFDSGVDPGAPGLQVTSHGLPKIIEMYDASGSGDVDTSTVVTVKNGEITGLSGKKLKIPFTWRNPTGNYHIGIKNILELYPRKDTGLKDKVLGLLKEKNWTGPHNVAEAEIARLLQKFDKEHPNTTQLSAKLKLEREELETRAEMLKANEKLLNIGIAYDCLVFHDGDMWRAVIDTSETGDLEKCTVLGPYNETLKYATLSIEDSYNYTINVYDDGNVLQIVGYTMTHGTHVASISAANFPGEPHRNGVAPGAQIINICIGDMRLDAMETGTALTRGAIKAIELKCDVINMSYGERSNWAGGRVLQRIEEIVHKHGIIFVTCGGNEGPALSTNRTPAMMKRLSVLSIGAYISPEMMEAEYSMCEKLHGGSYTWVSRGPTLMGDFGITVTAPGGAITSVPNYTLQNSELMNGTSMSSPHAAGAVAILLSGLKTKNVKYSPYSIERALKVTALKGPSYEQFSMGAGLIQVEKAFDWLLESENYIERDVFFHYSSSDTQLGIYLRESYQLSKPSVHSIKIEPAFLNEDEVESSRKIDFNINFNLVCNASWVNAPAHLCQSYGVRNFAIKVDPTGLPHGVHDTSICFYDSANVDKGPVFEYPITVIKPEMIVDTNWNNLSLNNLVMKPAQIHRQFIDVPVGATWAFVKVTSKEAEQVGIFVLQTIQFAEHQGSHINEFDKMFWLEAFEEFVCSFHVLESRTLEICLSKWWSNVGTLEVNVVVTFRGVKPSQCEITIQPSCGVHCVDVTSLLKREEISPLAILKSHVLVLRPNKSNIVPLGIRDIIPKDRQIYELQLTYSFNISKATEVSPTCPTLSKFLYENEYESQLWMIFDTNKRLFLSGDAINNKHCYETKLEKGDYVVKMQIRHEQKSLLEKLSDVLFEVSLKLSSPIFLDIYYSWPMAMTDGKKASYKKLSIGEVVPLYISGVPNDKLPKNSCPGHYLQGTIMYAKDNLGKKVNTYSIKYMIPKAPKKASTPKPTNQVKTPEEEYNEALRDLKAAWIPKLQGKSSEDVYKEAITQNADHIETILARIQYLDSKKERPADALKEIIKLSDEILKLIDLKELLGFFAEKNGKKQDPATYKFQEKQRAAVIEVLTKKGAAMADLVEQVTNAAGGAESSEASAEHKTDSIDTNRLPTLAEVDEVFAKLQKWADQYDTKVAQFVGKHAKAHKHYGRALKVLRKQIKDKTSIELEKNCIELYEKLGWNYCIKWAVNGLQVKFPPNYVPF